MSCPALVHPRRPTTASPAPTGRAPLARSHRRRARSRSRAPGTAAGARPGAGQPAASASSPSVSAAARRPRAGAGPPPRRKRALFVSSPIGLGHARRDVAIADELRAAASRPRDRLARPAPGHRACSRPRASASTPRARSWPTSRATSSRECAEHDLHCFQACGGWTRSWSPTSWSSTTSCTSEHYDLWIGDEAWEVDHYLHENPELKRAAYAWLTDFVGWLPMPEGGEREALLTADYNAEMIEHIARYPRVRDRAIFVGDPDDIVPDRFGPGLPAIRDWTEEHYDFAALRHRLRPGARSADRERAAGASSATATDEQVCVVTVGGSGVGRDLLRRVIDALPEAERRVPGPADDRRRRAAHRPGSLPAAREGLEVRAYVHDLYRHLAACDLAVVQGGLTTTMELAASGRPFLYFPLRDHFEQNLHVPPPARSLRRRAPDGLQRSSPDVIGSAIADEIGKQVTYRPIEPGAVSRVARRLAEML